MARNTKWHDELREDVLSDPEGASEYDSLTLQRKLAEEMKCMRKSAHLTQEDIAQKLHTSKSAIARLESGGGRGKHSPSLKTLAQYAEAIGCSLDIHLRQRRGSD